MSKRVVDSQVIRQLADETQRASDDIRSALGRCAANVGRAPTLPWERGWTWGSVEWGGVRGDIEHETTGWFGIGGLRGDATWLRQIAERVEIEAAAADAFERLWDWFSGLGSAAGKGASYVVEQLVAFPEFVGLVTGEAVSKLNSDLAAMLAPIENAAPVGSWQTISFKRSMTVPGAAFGVPAGSVEVVVTTTVKTRRNADGTVSIEVTKEYDGNLVANMTSLDPMAEAAGAKAGMRLTTTQEFKLDSDDGLGKAAVYAAAISDDPTGLRLLSGLMADHLVRDGVEIEGRIEGHADFAKGLFQVAGLKADAGLGVGTEMNVTSAGTHELEASFEINGSAAGHLLGASGEVSGEIKLGAVRVAETGQTYSKLTLEFKGEIGPEVIAKFRALDATVAIHADDSAYRAFRVEVSTDQPTEAIQAALNSGNFDGAMTAIGDHAHVVITGIQMESMTVGVNVEVTPVPTQTIGAGVDLTLGTQTDTVLFDNHRSPFGAALAPVGSGSGGSSGGGYGGGGGAD